MAIVNVHDMLRKRNPEKYEKMLGPAKKKSSSKKKKKEAPKEEVKEEVKEDE